MYFYNVHFLILEKGFTGIKPPAPRIGNFSLSRKMQKAYNSVIHY